MSDAAVAIGRSLRAWRRAGLLVLAVIALVPVQAFRRWRRPQDLPGRVPRLFHGLVLRVLGVRVQQVGIPLEAPRALWVCNHLSYLDIAVLGSLRDMRFVSKDEVDAWPVFGALAGLQDTIYISRRPSQAGVAAGRFATAMERGGNVVLFPEGTSSDGSTVLPFRPSLLEVLMAPGLRTTPIQPVTLRLLSVDGRPAVDLATRDLYAYHRDMALPTHLRAFLGLRGAVIQVIFHPTSSAAAFTHRRALAERLHANVAWGLAHGTAAS